MRVKELSTNISEKLSNILNDMKKLYLLGKSLVPQKRGLQASLLDCLERLKLVLDM